MANEEYTGLFHGYSLLSIYAAVWHDLLCSAALENACSVHSIRPLFMLFGKSRQISAGNRSQIVVKTGSATTALLPGINELYLRQRVEDESGVAE